MYFSKLVIIFLFIYLFCSISKEDEIHCLIKGCIFLLKNIPDEAFLYQRYGNPECKFQGVDPDIYPFLLVNIGSGVSIIKVGVWLFSTKFFLYSSVLLKDIRKSRCVK